MVQEHFVDFLGGNLLAAAIDHLAYAADEEQVSVVIEVTQVSGLEPVAGKRGLGRPWVAIVSRRHACAPNDDLAGLPVGQQSPSFVHDRDVQGHRHADRTRFTLARRQRIARDRRGRDFRHAVPLDHRRLESVLELREDAGRREGLTKNGRSEVDDRRAARRSAVRKPEWLGAWSAPRCTTTPQTS